MKKTILLLLLAMLYGSASAQQTINIAPDRDNTLFESETGALSNGSGAFFFVGRVEDRNNGLIRRGLLRFDIASEIPEGATIESVELTLFMSRTQAGATDVSLHQVFADWGEADSDAAGGEGGGTTATAGDATWIHRFSDDQTWNNAGGDFNNAPLASLSVGGTGSYTWESTPGLVSIVQDWLDNPNSNFGLLLRGDETSTGTAKRFDTRENVTEANRPVLAVTFSGVQVSNEDETEVPTTATLEQNFPNPFNPTTNIRFNLPAASNVQLNVYDILGRQVATLVNGVRAAGAHEVTFDATQLSSGIYIYTLEGVGFSLARKLTLVK